MTHLSAVVLQDLAHGRDRHLAQVTRDPLLLRKGTRQDDATAPGPPPFLPESQPFIPKAPPKGHLGVSRGTHPFSCSPCRHTPAQEHQWVFLWVLSIRGPGWGFLPSPTSWSWTGTSLHPLHPPSLHDYPRSLVPESGPAELQRPALGRRHHVAAPILRPLAAFVEGAGPGCRGERRLSASRPPHDHLLPRTTPRPDQHPGSSPALMLLPLPP